MRSVRFYLPVIFLGMIAITSSCKKYLDKKPEDDLVTPESIADCQGLLDNSLMNLFPYAAETLCDDYYLLASDWKALSGQGENAVIQKNLHIWQREDNTAAYWNDLYHDILITNIALDELPRMDYDPAHPAEYNNVKGSALFFRAFYFYHLAQLFAKPYNEATANSDLGIALRLDVNVEAPSVRASVKETYDQIIDDLKEATSFLPEKPLEGLKTRPSLPAAYGMLARTYLSMKEYDSAGWYADKCLTLHDSLMDYNTLDPNIPIPQYNREVMFAARSPHINNYTGNRAKIDSNLYKSYADPDLRKKIFFKANTGVIAGTYGFKGDYDGIGNPTGTFFSFLGIVSDEMYLIKAECLARNSSITLAMQALNDLLITRYQTGQFTPLTAITVNEALTIILRERRKELLRRGVRWSDIKRLENDPLFKINPRRFIDSLIAMPPSYLVLLPKKVIDLSGMPQN